MRYKCLICKDINVCGVCYEKRRRNKNYEHEPFHPHVLLNQLGSQKVQDKILDHIEEMGLDEANDKAIKSGKMDYKTECVGCNKLIRGILYQCDECISLSLCHDCYKQGYSKDSHTYLHPMLVFIIPVKHVYNMKDIKYNEEDIIGTGMFAKVYKAKVNGIKSD